MQNELTPEAVADLLSEQLSRPVAISTVYKWLREGRFPNALHLGEGKRSMWLIPPGDVATFQPPPRPGRRWTNKSPDE